MNKQTNRSLRWFHPDVPKSVKSHLLGQQHTQRHKFLFGMVIAFSGVLISEYTAHLGIEILALLGHHIGYGIHGIGYIPMYKAIEKETDL